MASFTQCNYFRIYVAYINNSFLFIVQESSIVNMYYSSFIHSPDVLLYSQVLAITNKAAVSMCPSLCLNMYLFFSWVIAKELLHQIVCLTF
jgi:hypothetical protein